VSIPKRSKALRAASKNFLRPGSIQHAAVLGAVKDKPPLAVAQGHSKNPACDGLDSFGTVFAEVLAGLGHMQSCGTDHV
jgi:hypothetical protein